VTLTVAVAVATAAVRTPAAWAAAVDAGLAAVLYAVAAARRLTDVAETHAAQAVVVGGAVVTVGAARARPAAVEAGLVAVFDNVAQLGALADVAGAHAALAVAGVVAALPFGHGPRPVLPPQSTPVSSPALPAVAAVRAAIAA
jgi:hypothetical protein